MTAQLSQERIEQYLQSAEGQKISDFDSGKLIAVEPDYVIALCRMALTGMNSEPIAYPEKLPCPVLLEPGMRFGKGVKTRLMLEAMQRRAEYYAELESMTPEQRAEHDAGIEEFKAMMTPPAPVAVPDGMPDAADLEFQIDMLEGFDANSDDKYNTQIICWLKELQRRRAAMLKAGPVTAATVPDGLASSVKCLPVDITDMRFVVCPGCGNKRCPRANDHRNACSGSNEPGQVGSAYPSAPEQEV